MGLDPSEEELQDMIREVDEDQSGSISFVEFVGKREIAMKHMPADRSHGRYGQESCAYQQEFARRTLSSLSSVRYTLMIF